MTDADVRFYLDQARADEEAAAARLAAVLGPVEEKTPDPEETA